ncbi:hypothetical protein F4774DRAFT_71406 [Daldinia eschscholtzii]|nr:hypothetical protein F4774DRAFT_71406 [Daldinia eschscholtzii]
MLNNSPLRSNNTTPSVKQPLFSPYATPRSFAPFSHEPQLCPCDQCVSTRLSQRMERMDLRSSHLEVAGDKAAANIQQEHHGIRPSRRNSIRRSESGSQPRYHQTPPPVVPPPYHPEMAYPEIYIYPKKSHITFPVVNYSAACRVQNRSSWPVCYLAISPKFAEPTDFEEALSPPGSGLAVVARLSKTQKTAPLRMFRDAAELRKESIQLEVWDENAIRVPGKRDHGTDIETGVPNGAEAESSKKKRTGNPVHTK